MPSWAWPDILSLSTSFLLVGTIPIVVFAIDDFVGITMQFPCIIESRKILDIRGSPTSELWEKERRDFT